MTTKHSSLILIVPGIRSGKPIICGTHITVADVLSYLSSGMSHAEIVKDFPPLTEEDILACLSYAAEYGVPDQP